MPRGVVLQSGAVGQQQEGGARLNRISNRTQEERNVRFYRRLGFVVIADEICPLGDGYRNWMMLREPRSQQPLSEFE